MAFLTVQQLKRCCNEGSQWEQHDWSFADQEKKGEEDLSVQTALFCSNVNVSNNPP